MRKAQLRQNPAKMGNLVGKTAVTPSRRSPHTYEQPQYSRQFSISQLDSLTDFREIQ